MKKIAIFLILIGGFAGISHGQDVPQYEASLIGKFSAPDARQGVAVDKSHFYAVDSYRITKHSKIDGSPVAQWDGVEYGKVIFHLDSGVVLNNRLYASHSNYGLRPMTSSIEVWDTMTMEHVGSYSFGIERGSFTWLDRYGGHWWGAFANYDRVQDGDSEPYGETRNTQVVKMDNKFKVVESWIIPDHILERIKPMSNSGGSWGPDGYLYLTGHDHGELYVMQLPDAGSVLHHAATVIVPNALQGQGIAWDRSAKGPRILWGISKSKREVYKVEMPIIKRTLPQSKGIIRKSDFNVN